MITLISCPVYCEFVVLMLEMFDSIVTLCVLMIYICFFFKGKMLVKFLDGKERSLSFTRTVSSLKARIGSMSKQETFLLHSSQRFFQNKTSDPTMALGHAML